MNDRRHNIWQTEPGSGPVAVSSKVDFSALDHAVLSLWDKERVFRRTIEERENCPDYVAYDGPPGTNGKPHIGHMMQSALKDLWPRYMTMKGFRVLRKAGWDTHGLPVELTAEKELGLKTKRDIAEYGVDKYIDYCRQTVYRYKDAWTEAIRRIGRFLDTDDFYATYTTDYIQTDWWVLKQAWDKGLLYQDRRIMPYCSRCGTSLSQHEVAQGYKDITDLTITAKFPVEGRENTFFIAWTTTPWTLLSNVALAVNPNLDYVTVERGDGEKLILVAGRLEALNEEIGKHKVIDKVKGASIAGLRYSPLWNFQKNKDAHLVIADEYVTDEDGTGVVHLAMYGEDDFRLIRKNGLPQTQNVDLDGKVTDNAAPFAGRWFRDEGLDVDILKDLAARGLLFGKEKYTHSYPHCYRCDSPLMYFAKSGWFVKTTAQKDQMLAANEEIDWYPKHIKQGRFGNWLENNVDWNISRDRYWGSPLPIWTCGGCRERTCVGSLKELGEKLGRDLPSDFDPHKPKIDRIELKCEKCNNVMHREPEVLDSWFNAGIMPWGQWGYPAKDGSGEIFKKQYPADFICEAIDQTRGWFYTLLATSTLLTNKSSFKNVICTELILDKQGQKMSKSRGNVVDPLELCEKYGADTVRWNFYRQNPWTVKRFNEDDLVDVLKMVIIPYWNAYTFFVTYARVDGWRPPEEFKPSDKLLDNWILSRLEWLRETVEKGLDGYDVTAAASAFSQFIDELTNWYIRRSRRRFWKSEDDSDKQAAYGTLYTVLSNLNRMLAPFMPFITEAVYQNLERAFDRDSADSVHLAKWVEPHSSYRKPAIEESMAQVREVVSIARSLRNEGGIRVRQPLREVIVHGSTDSLDEESIELILDELNVKQFRRTDDTVELFEYRAKADFKALGPRFGKRIKEVAAEIGKLSDSDIRSIIANGLGEVAGEQISVEEIILEQIPRGSLWIRSDGGLTVAVDHEVTGGLHLEWLAREFVHQVQNMRRDENLVITARIHLEFDGTDVLCKAVSAHREYIENETLATKVERQLDLNASEKLQIGNQEGAIRLAASSN